MARKAWQGISMRLYALRFFFLPANLIYVCWDRKPGIPEYFEADKF